MTPTAKAALLTAAVRVQEMRRAVEQKLETSTHALGLATASDLAALTRSSSRLARRGRHLAERLEALTVAVPRQNVPGAEK